MKYAATIACLLFVGYLFWGDRQKTEGDSSALWIPFAWMFFCGSRYFAWWLSLVGLNIGGSGTSDDGNPVNASCFFLLIAAGVVVLGRRKIDWGVLLWQNRWIWLYFLFCFVSITWSDYPFIALKRWIKDLGNPIMVLVILTEESPSEALAWLLKRLAFVWLPVSVLFVKYYPELGRVYSPGGMSLSGIAAEKNGLGMICWMSGTYFAWNYLLAEKKKDSKLGERFGLGGFILMAMIPWLLYQSQSATSFSCLLVVIGLLALSKTRLIMNRPSSIVYLTVIGGSLCVALNAALGISDIVIQGLGRDSTLTNRTDIWEIVKQFPVNPFLGAGYQSFWAGERLQRLCERIGAPINQAHNGYLEQYLNLGYVGVTFIGIILLSGLVKVRRRLGVDYPLAVLSLCFIVTAILYNYTEASFYGLSNMWLLTLFAVIENSGQDQHETVCWDGPKSWSRISDLPS